MPDGVNLSGPALDTVALRLALLAGGYKPVPLYPHDATVTGAGKRPMGNGWLDRASKAGAEVIRSWPEGNTGVLSGAACGVDIDIGHDRAMAEQLEALALQMLGAGPLRRIGKAPKVLLLYRADTPGPKLETPELLMPCGAKCQVEILGAGQQFVAYGVHPDTGQPYRWDGAGPLDVELGAVPVVRRDDLIEFCAAAETLLRDAGGRTEKEIRRAEQDRVHAARGRQAEPAPARPGAKAGGKSQFFRGVNTAALADLAAWVPRVLPGAVLQPGTRAWRVDSQTLNRGFEEDLSIHPDGIQDWGSRRGLSPIDLVIEFGGAPDAVAAAHALCDFLGRSPADFGWSEPRRSKGGEGEGEAGDDDLELTEDGVARLFEAKHASTFRYCEDTGQWHQWSGRHWGVAMRGAAFTWARNLVRQLNRTSDFKAKAITGKASFAGAVETFARKGELAIRADALDADRFLLGTPGGTVDLRTGKLRPAAQSDFITKLAGTVPAAPGTPARLWLRFLHEATQGDDALTGADETP